MISEVMRITLEELMGKILSDMNQRYFVLLVTVEAEVEVEYQDLLHL
jgi:hypothetical protein